jgi:uncharacterized small protein (DUF1192 family)
LRGVMRDFCSSRIFSENRYPPRIAYSELQWPGFDGAQFGLRSLPVLCVTALQNLIPRNPMSNGSTLSLPELEDRIAITRDNIRQLVEQAAAFSGAGDESRSADRIAQQTEELERLTKERDALLKKRG